jgi:hypothetical protein
MPFLYNIFKFGVGFPGPFENTNRLFVFKGDRKLMNGADAPAAKEHAMVQALRAGRDMVEVDREFNYEQMLK